MMKITYLLTLSLIISNTGVCSKDSLISPTLFHKDIYQCHENGKITYKSENCDDPKTQSKLKYSERINKSDNNNQQKAVNEYFAAIRAQNELINNNLTKIHVGMLREEFLNLFPSPQAPEIRFDCVEDKISEITYCGLTVKTTESVYGINELWTWGTGTRAKHYYFVDGKLTKIQQ